MAGLLDDAVNVLKVTLVLWMHLDLGTILFNKRHTISLGMH